MPERAYSLLVEPDQWVRCAHRNTALLPGGGVELTWTAPPERPTACHPPVGTAFPPSGLAFDEHCRGYRSRPESACVELVAEPGGTLCPGPLHDPGPLAVDADQRLYVVETPTGFIHVVDLADRRQLRRVRLGRGRMIGVAAHGRGVLVLTQRPDRLVAVEGRNPPRPGPELIRPCFPPGMQPTAICRGPLVLWRRDTDGLSVLARPDGGTVLEVGDARTVDAATDGRVIIGSGPGRPIRRFRIDEAGGVELEPLEALDHDGRAVAIAPNGRVAFTTASGSGVGWTSGSVAEHERAGWVVSYRMDSGVYRTRWGRVFVDACAPVGTAVGLRFITTDEDAVADPIEGTAPDRGTRRVPHPDASPPLPPRYLLEDAESRAPVALYRRPPAARHPSDAPGAPADFDVYEAPVQAPPGRYLWLQIVLSGTRRSSPRVRSVRVERPGHDLLATLPRSWSRNEPDTAFLFRLLAPAEGLLNDLDQRATLRHLLLSAHSTPEDLLPWLASFAGLTLDDRWPVGARRTLVAEAYRLFRRRGTRQALIRLIEIYLGRPPTIVEDWQLRGLSGIVLGTLPLGAELAGPPAISGSARTTGTLGRVALGENTGRPSSYAHRFTVLVPGRLSAEQRAVVADILEQHRPAHTACCICELGDGMVVGHQARAGVSSYVGPGSRPDAVVGRALVVGSTSLGTTAVGGAVGVDATIGQVRVG